MTHSIRSLRDDAALQIEEGACLPLRSMFGRCSACAQACPAGVLRVSTASVELSGGCLNCGRCAAVCLTGALVLEGYGFAPIPDAVSDTLRVDCWKVMPSRTGTDTVRVPCLGGLSSGRLLELWRAAGEAGLELVDRGWCATCNAGGGERHPAQRALDAARRWLEAVGIEEHRLPRIVSRPLPAHEAPKDIPAPETARLISRRQFFRAITAPVPVGGPGAPAFPAGARRESTERRRSLNALSAIAAEQGTALPGEFFPRVANNGDCADHRICAAACPTGALAVHTSDGRIALEFDAEHCIACGACERACPEHALSLDVRGGQRERRVLALHHPRRCTRCGEQYAIQDDDDGMCLSCRKTWKFLRSGAAIWRAVRQ